MVQLAALPALANALGIGFAMAAFIWALAGRLGYQPQLRDWLDAWQAGSAEARAALRSLVLSRIWGDMKTPEAAMTARENDSTSDIVASQLQRELVATEAERGPVGQTSPPNLLRFEQEAIAEGDEEQAVHWATLYITTQTTDDAKIASHVQIARDDARAHHMTRAVGHEVPVVTDIPVPRERPAVTTLAPPLPGVAVPSVPQELPGGLTIPIAGAIGTALGLTLAQSLPQALSAVGQDLGHKLHRGRLQSTQSTFETLRGVLTTAMPLVGLGSFILNPSGQGPKVSEIFGRFLDNVLDPDRFPQPLVDGHGVPLAGRAREAAAQQVAERMLWGLSAHGLSQAAELATPLKHMGFSQLAGFMADLAGFPRLATAMMMPYEFAGITQPLRLDANRRFRTTIPNEVEIERLYSKKAITPAEMARLMALSGYPDIWAERIRDAAFREPRIADIIRVGQFWQPSLTPELATPPVDVVDWWTRRGDWLHQYEQLGMTRTTLLGADWWLYYKLSQSGWDPVDIRILAETAKRATARREQGLMLGVATRQHHDGMIDDTQLRARIDEAWDLTDPKAARIRAAQLATDAGVRGQIRDIVLRMVSRGVLPSEQAQRLLEELGMPTVRARLALMMDRLSILPKPALVGAGDESGLLAELEVS